MWCVSRAGRETAIRTRDVPLGAGGRECVDVRSDDARVELRRLADYTHLLAGVLLGTSISVDAPWAGRRGKMGMMLRDTP